MNNKNKAVRKIRDMNAVNIPQEMMNSLGLKKGNYVYVIEEVDRLIITPAKPLFEPNKPSNLNEDE